MLDRMLRILYNESTKQGATMTTEEISMWIDKKTMLFMWWKSTRLPKDDFIALYRADLRNTIYQIMYETDEE